MCSIVCIAYCNWHKVHACTNPRETRISSDTEHACSNICMVEHALRSKVDGIRREGMACK